MAAHRTRMFKECEDLTRVELSQWGWLHWKTDEKQFKSEWLAPFNKEQLARRRVTRERGSDFIFSKSLVICHYLFSFNWARELALFCLRMSSKSSVLQSAPEVTCLPVSQLTALQSKPSCTPASPWGEKIEQSRSKLIFGQEHTVPIFPRWCTLGSYPV